MKRSHVPRLVVAVAVSSLSTCSVAAAAPSRSELARAERLFEEGITLKQRARFDEACPKLEESQRLDPGLGTQYHLADCWERQGRTASAWALFDEIARQASVSGQHERERIARDRQSELSARVPKLSVAVPVASDVGGLRVWRDGIALERPQWNAPIALDPGLHEIVARVGERTWRVRVSLEARAKTETVLVPDLGGLDARSGLSLSAGVERGERSPKPTNGPRLVGIGLSVLGALALGAVVSHYAQ